MPYGNQVFNQSPLNNGTAVNQPANVPFQQAPLGTNPFGSVEVSGFDGVNRYPVAPGASVSLKDVNSDLTYIKSRDIAGNLLPYRVFRVTDVTEEFQQNEEPVTRKEFKELQGAIEKLSQTLEFLTAPAVKEDNTHA